MFSIPFRSRACLWSDGEEGVDILERCGEHYLIVGHKPKNQKKSHKSLMQFYGFSIYKVTAIVEKPQSCSSRLVSQCHCLLPEKEKSKLSFGECNKKK